MIETRTKLCSVVYEGRIYRRICHKYYNAAEGEQ